MTAFDNGQYEQTGKAYAAEVKQRWGETDAYKESCAKTAGRSGAAQGAAIAALQNAFSQFAACMAAGKTPQSEAAQAAVENLQNCITANFYTCTPAILAGLGQMYVADERFKNNIDAHGEGTAQYAAQAIAAYCAK